ncbi:MAG: hypothetical protein MUE46_02735 [Xanthomonadales bacterium]|nr:hypothetical protein [Xanthomonadales bacterium]
MNETAQALERFHSLNNTYTGYTLRGTEQQSPRQGSVVYYQISLLVRNEGTAYTITAAPQQEDRCGVLTINNLGQRTAAHEDCLR